MKTTLRLLALAIALAGITLTATATDYVRGYTRRDGTYVSPHYRSSANSTVRDNWSYRGNTNPYSGSTGGSYYRSSPSSEYYRGYTAPSYDAPYYRLRR
jgi:hypothetical protein